MKQIQIHSDTLKPILLYIRLQNVVADKSYIVICYTVATTDDDFIFLQNPFKYLKAFVLGKPMMFLS